MKLIHPKGTLEAHELADIMPETTGDAYSQICDGMKREGFNPAHPIVMLDGKVLDGRTRYRACLDTGTEPLFRDFDPAKDGEPVFFVERENVRRRHLSPGQRATLALALLPYIQAAREAAKNQTPPPPPPPVETEEKPGIAETPDQNAETPPEQPPAPAPAQRLAEVAAQATGASTTNVKNAKRLEKEAPDLYTKVQSGEITISAAMAQLEERNLAAKDRAKKEKEKGERKEALKNIIETHGAESEIAKAAKDKKILKVHDDLLVFSTLEKFTGAKLFKLLLKGWRLDKAQKFLSGKLLPESSIEDLIAFAVASENDPFEVEIAGHWITVTKNDGSRA